MPRRIRPYEQTLIDSCLTCCLLMMGRHYGKVRRITKQLELRLLTAGLRFDRKSYDTGQLHETARRYKIDLDYFVEKLDEFHYARQLPFSRRIVIHNRKIDPDFIRQMLGKGPAIISLDPFGLLDDSHYSHYVLLTGSKNGFFSIIDTWTGEEKALGRREISRGLRGLRRLGFSPVLIAKRNGDA